VQEVVAFLGAMKGSLQNQKDFVAWLWTCAGADIVDFGVNVVKTGKVAGQSLNCPRW